jgi:hypothetical protein
MVLSPECFYGPVLETLPNRELKNGNVARSGQIVSWRPARQVSLHRIWHRWAIGRPTLETLPNAVLTLLLARNFNVNREGACAQQLTQLLFDYFQESVATLDAGSV